MKSGAKLPALKALTLRILVVTAIDLVRWELSRHVDEQINGNLDAGFPGGSIPPWGPSRHWVRRTRCDGWRLLLLPLTIQSW